MHHYSNIEINENSPIQISSAAGRWAVRVSMDEPGGIRRLSINRETVVGPACYWTGMVPGFVLKNLADCSNLPIKIRLRAARPYF